MLSYGYQKDQGPECRIKLETSYYAPCKFCLDVGNHVLKAEHDVETRRIWLCDRCLKEVRDVFVMGNYEK